MPYKGEAMSLPAYEIFKKEQTDFGWELFKNSNPQKSASRSYQATAMLSL